MLKYAIIVAGGKGLRMETNTPKQFIVVKGLPILMHTIEKFRTTFQDIKIILVLPEDQLDHWEELCVLYHFSKENLQTTVGGETRFHSVKNGLQLTTENSIIGVHDAVRPLASSDTIRRAYQSAMENGSGVPITDMVESIRKVEGDKNQPLDRSMYKIVQTPQCFQSHLIQSAYNQSISSNSTDDASLVEEFGHQITLVEGNVENIKITTPKDIILLKEFLS